MRRSAHSKSSPSWCWQRAILHRVQTSVVDIEIVATGASIKAHTAILAAKTHDVAGSRVQRRHQPNSADCWKFRDSMASKLGRRLPAKRWALFIVSSQNLSQLQDDECPPYARRCKPFNSTRSRQAVFEANCELDRRRTLRARSHAAWSAPPQKAAAAT
jgi:hypothetical protein